MIFFCLTLWHHRISRPTGAICFVGGIYWSRCPSYVPHLWKGGNHCLLDSLRGGMHTDCALRNQVVYWWEEIGVYNGPITCANLWGFILKKDVYTITTWYYTYTTLHYKVVWNAHCMDCIMLKLCGLGRTTPTVPVLCSMGDQSIWSLVTNFLEFLAIHWESARSTIHSYVIRVFLWFIR